MTYRHDLNYFRKDFKCIGGKMAIKNEIEAAALIYSDFPQTV